MPMFDGSLPVEDCLDELKQRLRERDEVVLEAPPGAGKTTLVPLALLDEEWLAGKKILLLEPRRIATRSAAARMASLLGEPPGQTVGYRMRLETRVGKNTRIEIITEGILTRMLQQDPLLDGVGLVIFDEFHERHLDSDLALALCLQGRRLFGEEQNVGPRILVMSATLDSVKIAELLGAAPIVNSEGRLFPVEIVYGRAREARERIDERVLAATQRALVDNPDSSLLVFLPGQGEIHRVADGLADWLRERKMTDVHLHPLYGNLSIDEQQQAIAPLSGRLAGERKVVLATNIAETSLTIEGIDVVIDSGFARQSRFEPATGMSGLHTVKISAASSEQRAGRAGRLGPGKCYRLWSAEQQKQLAAFTEPEILHADLAPLALQLLQWGVDDPGELDWLDPPPAAHWGQALDLLDALGALELKNRSRVLGAHGRAMASLPLHPRLAHLLLRGRESGLGDTAALLASLLSERDPLSQKDPDIADRLDLLAGETGCPPGLKNWLARARRLARQLEQQLSAIKPEREPLASLLDVRQKAGFLLACAYPDRIARRRHSGGYQLANGRSAKLAGEFALGRQRWLAVAEISTIAGGQGDIIRSAAALDERLFDGLLAELVREHTVAEWDKKSGRFVAETRRQVGALVLSRETENEVSPEARQAALIEYLRRENLEPLPWDEATELWCARVALLRSVDADGGWPDLGRETLQATLEDWLAPYLDKIKNLADFKKLKLRDILAARLDWEQQQRLERLAPARLQVPSGSSIAIDYRQSPPVLAVKLQEMFGCETTPRVVDGRVELMVHLLSPAGRPLQVTQDLAGFWRSSYHDVKKDMKGRYPKHPWPDDPLQAQATRHTKKRAT